VARRGGKKTPLWRAAPPWEEKSLLWRAGPLESGATWERGRDRGTREGVFGMKAVIQRVSGATLTIGGVEHARIGRGFVVLLGVEVGDEEVDRAYVAEKIAVLRVFADEAGKMNLALADVGGEVLLAPNFTLAGDCRKGRRPSFDGAMKPPEAKAMFERVAAGISAAGVVVRTGVFGADMQVSLTNDGPITLWLDSRERG